MKAFILAGGFATRLWPLTEKRAKPLLPIAGKPLISYVVDGIPEGIPVTVSTNAVFGRDFGHWKKTMKKNVTVVIEDAGHEKQKLGALGAVAKWVKEEKIDDDILLLAGDNYADCSIPDFLKLFAGNPLVAGYDIKSLEAAKAFGTIVLARLPSPGTGEGQGGGGGVAGFEEKPLHPKSTIVSTGWSVLPRSSLPVLLEYSAKHPDNIGGIFEEFLRRGTPVDCFVFSGIWKDIGSFEAYMALHRQVVGERRIVSPSASIDAESKLLGAIDVGPKTRIEKSTLSDCIVFGQSTIRDSVLTRCIIDEGCVLEGIDLTDQMIREGTVLGE